MNIKTFLALCGLVLAAASAPAQTGTAGAASTPTGAASPAASAPPVKAAAGDARAGIVKSVRGDVQLLGGSAEPRPAVAGDAVAPIDRLQTGKDSGASVVLRDGTTLVVGPSSRLDLKQFHFDATTQDGGMLVSLLRGTLRMVTGLIGKTHPDAVRVETQTAVIGIRGTDFIVEADAQP